MDKKKASIVSVVLAVLLGAGVYVTNDKDVGAAVKILLDKDAAKAACSDLLEGKKPEVE